LPVAAKISKAQECRLENGEKTGWSAPVLHVRPAHFRDTGKIKTVTLPNEACLCGAKALAPGRFIHVTARGNPRPLLRASILILRGRDGRSRGNIEISAHFPSAFPEA